MRLTLPTRLGQISPPTFPEEFSVIDEPHHVGIPGGEHLNPLCFPSSDDLEINLGPLHDVVPHLPCHEAILVGDARHHTSIKNLAPIIIL